MTHAHTPNSIESNFPISFSFRRASLSLPHFRFLLVVSARDLLCVCVYLYLRMWAPYDRMNGNENENTDKTKLSSVFFFLLGNFTYKNGVSNKATMALVFAFTLENSRKSNAYPHFRRIPYNFRNGKYFLRSVSSANDANYSIQ